MLIFAKERAPASLRRIELLVRLISLPMAGVSVKTCSNIPVVRPYGLALCVRPFRQTALVKAAAHRHELPRRVSNTSVGRVEAKANAGPLFRAQQFIRNNIVKVIGAVALACFMVRGLSGIGSSGHILHHWMPAVCAS